MVLLTFTFSCHQYSHSDQVLCVKEDMTNLRMHTRNEQKAALL